MKGKQQCWLQFCGVTQAGFRWLRVRHSTHRCEDHGAGSIREPFQSFHTVRYSCQNKCICASYRGVAENPPCISQVLFVPSTIGKKHGLFGLLRVHGSHMAASRESPKHVRSALFFFFSQTAFSVREGGLDWDRLFLPIPQSCPSRAAAPPVFESREKRALFARFTVSGLATSFFSFFFFCFS